MNKMANIFAFLICGVYFLVLSGQEENRDSLPRHLRESGYPFVQNYSPGDYPGFDQNWGAVQDSLGILYFANGDGVLTYDGVHWELLELPTVESVFSLAIDSDGKIFVGAQRELGYLEADETGKLQYVSLMSFLPNEGRDFYVMWRTLATPRGIYFNDRKYLLRWDGKEFKVWKNGSGKNLDSFFVHDILFSNQEGKGLMRMVGDELKEVTGGKRFADARIRFMVPYEQRVMVGTTDSLFIYDGKNFKPFFTDSPDFFSDGQLYCGLTLPDGTIALGSLQKGIMVIDRKGRKRSLLKTDSGLLSNQITNLFHDRSGVLWATLFTGISKVEYPSPFSTFGGENIDGAIIFEIVRYNGKIFVATSTGLYFLDIQKKGAKPPLQLFSDEVGHIWDMLLFEDCLLVGGDQGVFEIGNGNRITQLSKNTVNFMQRSNLNPDRVFLGLNPGLGTLFYKDKKWSEELTDRNINEEVPQIIEQQDGTLWLGTDHGRLVKLSFTSVENARNLYKPKVTYYIEENGIPKDVGKPYLIGNNVYFHVIIGENAGTLYAYNAQTDTFVNDSDLYRSWGFERGKVRINRVDRSGNIWLTTFEDKKPQEQFLVIESPVDNFQVLVLNASRINGVRRGARYFEPEDSVVWHGLKNGILRHGLKEGLNPSNYVPKPYMSKIRYQNDSVLYSGRGVGTNPELPFEKNQFRYEYALLSYYEEKENQYQYLLDGFDSEWSDWSSETRKDYTSLPEGHYNFKVRGKDIFGKISDEETFFFTILPPWYRTWWAYLLYTFFGAFLIWLYSIWRSRQLQRKNLVLEGIIKRRTKEISDKNKLLGYQTERLKELDIMKTRLFANISHEFRTPLTLIKGPIEKLEAAQENKISTPNIKMIRRNANRLLNLVNQLLDLSKLDSGKLRLNEAEGDVFKCMRAAASAFSSHAASRNMDYQVKIPSKSLWASFDRDKMEKTIYNLLSNAFKFTDDEGRVTIEAEFRSERLRLKISDTGSGIATDKLPHIFDRFFQVDDSYTKEKAGTGIGLALTKELVELMAGTIYVESEEGRGTLFRVVLPLEEIQSNRIEGPQEIPLAVFDDGEEEVPESKKGVSEIKILIIEDNSDMRHFIREQLDPDYGILEARNGKEGLKIANKMVPALIVTDLMMPQMDGITLCKKLKTDIATSHIPVIMLTAKAGVENKLEGLETGADDYLTKPFNAKELQVRTRNLIAQRQQLRELFSRNISLDPKDITVTSLDEEFLRKLLTLLEEKYADSEFGVPQMQKTLGMGKTRLHGKVKVLTNHPPGELLRNFRLKRASQLLLRKADNISQTAYDVGFNSLSYFTRCFKEFYGMSPSEYIQKNS